MKEETRQRLLSALADLGRIVGKLAEGDLTVPTHKKARTEEVATIEAVRRIQNRRINVAPTITYGIKIERLLLEPAEG